MCQNCERRAQEQAAAAASTHDKATASGGQGATNKAPVQPVMIVTGSTRVSLAPLAGLKGALEVANRINGVLRSNTSNLTLSVLSGAGLAAEGAGTSHEDSEEFLRTGTVKAFGALLRLAASQGLTAQALLEETRSMYEAEANAEVKDALVGELRARGMLDLA